MTPFRLISLPVHAALELVAGLALMGAPFALGFGAAGTVAAFALGAVLVGIGLGAAESLPLAAHLALDEGLGAILVAGALGLALAGDRAAATVLLTAGLTQLLLASTTRYTRTSHVPRSF